MRYLRLLADGQPAPRPGAGRPEIWEVVEVRPDAAGIEHVVLSDVDQPDRRKTLALEVLKDKNRYRQKPSVTAGHVKIFPRLEAR
jgi:hypothetical protein